MPKSLRNRRVVQDDSDDEHSESDAAPAKKPVAVENDSPRRTLPTRASRTRLAGAQIAISPETGDVQAHIQKAKATSEARDARSSPQKAKTEKKDAGTIFSFFNRTTQRQQTPRSHGNGSEKENDSQAPGAPEDELEEIEDDVEESVRDETVASSTMVRSASRDSTKRARSTVELTPTFGLQERARKFVKTATGLRVRSETPRPMSSSVKQPQDLRAWTEKYAPRMWDELGINKKKAAEVEGWMQRAFGGQGRQRTLVLRGPAGSGKTSVVDLAAARLNVELKRWSNPSTGDFAAGTFVSWASQFEDYVGNGSKFQALDLSNSLEKAPAGPDDGQKQLLVIEEFPSLASDSALKAFRSVLLQQISFNATRAATFEARMLAPTILIVSESVVSNSSNLADKFTAHRLLGPDILNHPHVDTIEFNEVAPTFLSKAIKLVLQKRASETRRQSFAGPKVVAKLSQLKDLRQAVSALEFLESQVKQPAVTLTKSRDSAKGVLSNKDAAQEAERAMLALIEERHGSLGLFHAVGKVVYNKRTLTESNSTTPTSKPDSEVDVDTLYSSTGTDTSTFISALHENFLLSCYTDVENHDIELDSVNACLDSLGDADLLSNTSSKTGAGTYMAATGEAIRQEEVAFHVAVRGVLDGLPWPLKRQAPKFTGSLARKRYDHHRMYYPKDLKLWRLREDTVACLARISARMLDGSLDMELARGNPRASSDGWTTSGQPLSMTGASSARNELLLDRLPYIAVVYLDRCGPGQLRRDIEDVARFGRNALLDGGDEQSGDEAADPQESSRTREKGTFNSTSASWWQKGAAPSKEALTSDGPAQLERLVLSDDDIEDDDDEP